jgi:hypothetical protein
MQIAQDSSLRRERVEIRSRGVARAAVAVAPEKGAMSKVEKWGGDKRLQTQTAQIAQDTTTIRSLDWDRDRFDMCVSRAGSLEGSSLYMFCANFQTWLACACSPGFSESFDPTIHNAADVSLRCRNRGLRVLSLDGAGISGGVLAGNHFWTSNICCATQRPVLVAFVILFGSYDRAYWGRLQEGSGV